MSSKELKLSLKGLDCANCATKIEDRINSLMEVNVANLNFALGIIIVDLKEESKRNIVKEAIITIVKSLEPDVIVDDYIARYEVKNINTCNSECCVEGDHCHKGEKEEEHHHGHDHNKGTKIKDNWLLLLGIFIYIVAMLLGSDKGFVLVLFLASYILVGYKVVLSAIRNIISGQFFDENFLMTLATFGAIAIAAYPEAVAVMIFYEIGEIFQSYAVNKSRKSISSLMNIKAEYANLVEGNLERKVSPESLKIDDIIIIKPGERVPLDGIIISGNTTLDTSALTGESLPKDISVSEEIMAGTINLTGVIKVKVNKLFGESTVARILELVENASSKKAPTEKFITKFSKYYTPIVVMLAVLLAIIPPLVIQDANFSNWLYRALIFLVVSCPCALVVSIPLALFAGIGGASKKGILVKGGNYLEALKDVEIVVFDKTGTLTKGAFKVTKVNEIEIDKQELLRIAAMGESFSNHPIARSIVKEYNKEIDKSLIHDYKEISGNGISAKIDNKKILLGNDKLMKENNISYSYHDEGSTIVHVVIDNNYKGYIVIADEIKEDAKAAIDGLKRIGIKKTVMLTGDNKKIADKIGKELGIDNVYAELLPGDKVYKIEELLKGKSSKGKVVFIGDGVNDAPVLARADIGVAMGGIGSDAAIEAADVVLMKDEPSSIIDAINCGRRINKILWQNIIISLGIKTIVLVLGAMGYATMWEGVFADVGVTIIAVLNSMRALKS